MTYTTGELAKLSSVSVRTVQYYDTRGIVSPSYFSEGGRRLYTEADLAKMKLVCYLRELDLSLGSIAEILKEDHSENVIALILSEHEKELSSEMERTRQRLSGLRELRGLLKQGELVTPAAIGSIATMMKTKNELKRVRMTMLLSGISMGFLEIASIILWLANGIWWPFAVYAAVAVPYAVLISIFYFKRVDYLCPSCGWVFHPRFREAFWANHTPKTRKLRCPHCRHRGFCVETYHGEESDESVDA